MNRTVLLASAAFLQAPRVWLCVLLASLCLSSPAQNDDTWEQLFDQTGQLEDTESDLWEQTYEELNDIASQKIDINHCTREDLGKLGLWWRRSRTPHDPSRRMPFGLQRHCYGSPNHLR